MACNCNCGDPNDIIHIRRSELDALRQEIKRLEVECSISVEQGEKARKWDDFNTSPDVKKWLEEMSAKANEWKEKAKNWYDLIERFQFSPPDNIIYTITEWREKAKNWDLVKDMQISSTGITLETELAVNPPIKVVDYEHFGYTVAAKAKWYDENRGKLEEKARKYDELCTDGEKKLFKIRQILDD